MMREEILEQALKYANQVSAEYTIPESIVRLVKGAFVAGSVFANNHPKNIWHDASEEPQGEWEILILDNVGDYFSYTKEEVRQTYDVKRGWKGFVKGAEVVKWAYISDII